MLCRKLQTSADLQIDLQLHISLLYAMVQHSQYSHQLCNAFPTFKPVDAPEPSLLSNLTLSNGATDTKGYAGTF